MSTQPSGIYDSISAGTPNETILESIGNQVLEEHSSPADPGGSGSPVPPSGSDDSVQAPAGEVQAAPPPEWYEAAPPEIKALLEHKNISNEQKEFLKALYGDIHSIRETPIGTKESITELSTMFPGGMDDIKKAAEDAQAYSREMELYGSADPVKQTELLGELLTSKPDAFVAMMPVAADLLRQTLRDDYMAFASKITRSHIDEVTDGNFSKFGDSTLALAQSYRQALASGNQEEANRIASQLAGTALQYADWWSGSAKNKMGFGEQPASTAAPGRTPIARTQESPNDPAIIYAQKDAGYFQTDYIAKHDRLVDPMIQNSLTRELGVRKMELSARVKQDVMANVGTQIKRALANDPTFKAIEMRTYYKGDMKDPRKWDNSDKVKEVLLAQVKTRAEKLMPAYLKQALDYISEMRGPAAATKPAQQPAAAARSSATGPAAAAGDKGGGNWKDKLKAGQIDNAQALLEMTGQV